MQSQFHYSDLSKKNGWVESTAFPKKAVRRFFLVAFACACLLFWWLPSLLYRYVLGVADPVKNETINISVLAWITFTIGFLLFQAHPGHTPKVNTRRMDRIARYSRNLTIAFFLPALLISISFLAYRNTVNYGEGQGLPNSYQVILYGHLFLGLLYLSTISKWKNNRDIWLIAIMLILPRLIISLGWGRFFLAQSIMPILLIGVARGWIIFSAKKILNFAIILVVIIFIPAVTRGDAIFGTTGIYSFFANGSTLGVYQENIGLNISNRCIPILISFTAKIIPYAELGICTINVWGMEHLPATLDRLLAFEEIGHAQILIGPGSNYLLELYLLGGISAIVCGSMLFGASCSLFSGAISTRSAYAGIWAECLTRALFAPRGNLGYVYEKIPILVVATFFLCLLFDWIGQLKKMHLALK